ncbi:MAG: hypothetical protein JJE46_11810 [Acidimicrobiia bacterium]|nr:hypothetical protein [Acidimicrobiia bacterium]
MRSIGLPVDLQIVCAEAIHGESISGVGKFEGEGKVCVDGVTLPEAVVGLTGLDRAGGSCWSR